MSELSPAPISPRWGPMTKMVVGLTLVAIIGALVIQFRSIIGPLLLAFILSYLLHPVTELFSKYTRLSWRASVNVLFLLLVVIYLGSITVTGVTVFQQLQSLVSFIGSQVKDLPTLVAQLSTIEFRLGPFAFSLAQYDLPALTNQLLSIVQPLLGRLGGVFGSLAGGAASLVGWGFFIVLISYFILGDANRFQNELIHVEIPGYDHDIRRLGDELRKIWNSYLRGQVIIFALVVTLYTILMGILGVRFGIGIAVLSGLARFVPYIGPWSVGVVTLLAAYFQQGNYFHLEPWQYALLVLVAAVVLDQIVDNLVSPRLLGDTLGVHPAAVLVAAIIAANLIGFVGLLLAAPVLATLQLAGRYIARKLFDLDPWPVGQAATSSRKAEPPLDRWKKRLAALVRLFRRHKPIS